MEMKEKYYEKILRNHKSDSFDFYAPAIELINKYPDTQNNIFLSVTALVIAPVLTSYILWVLQDAIKHKIDTLLFQARDGFAMYKIAQILCKTWGLDINCEYFYASRQSLRLPLYAIDKAYTLKQHFDPNSNNNDLQAVLTAAGLTPYECDDVLQHINPKNDIQTELENSALFDKYAFERASKALEDARGYFNQIVPRSFALVDSGWIGNIQESFGKLHEYFTGQSRDTVRGYYFGMISTPPQNAGIYNSYYFSPKKYFRRFNGFCINLFESLCAAEHGRTIGYKREGEKWMPVLTENEAKGHIAGQIKMYETYASFFTQHNDKTHQLQDMCPTIHKLLHAFMHNPSKEEAEAYGTIPFSRWVLDNDMSTLARPLTKNEIRQYTLSWRIINKRRIKNQVFWRQGAAALSNISWIQKLDVKLLLFAYWLKIKMKGNYR